MAIDFGKISSGNTSNTAIHPREIFIALPGKKKENMNIQGMFKHKFGSIGF